MQNLFRRVITSDGAWNEASDCDSLLYGWITDFSQCASRVVSQLPSQAERQVLGRQIRRLGTESVDPSPRSSRRKRSPRAVTTASTTTEGGNRQDTCAAVLSPNGTSRLSS